MAKPLALLTLACIVLLSGVAAASAQTPQSPEGGTVKAQHGDWQVVCRPPPPGARGEICGVVQRVTAEDHNNIGLGVYFQRFSDGKKVLRVFAPLGVLLPRGLGLSIDNKSLGPVPFVRCSMYGCYAQIPLEDKLIEQLKSGKQAVFVIYQTEESGIGIPVSLAGFGQAIAALN